MTDESALAPEAGPEIVPETLVETPEEGQVEAQTAEGDDPPPEDNKPSAAKARRERQKAHFSRLETERAAAEQRARDAEDRVARLQATAQRIARPTDAEFPDPIDFAAAQAVWRMSQAQSEQMAEQIGSEVQEARSQAEQIEAQRKQAVNVAWRESVEEAKSRYADFEAVAYHAPISDGVAAMIAESDVGPDVAYYLGKNPAIAKQISEAHPLEAARALGRIEATVTQSRAKPATSAPPPITPIKGGSVATKDPAKMSFAEFKAYREKGGKL
jgi:hypothetical protein